MAIPPEQDDRFLHPRRQTVGLRNISLALSVQYLCILISLGRTDEPKASSALLLKIRSATAAPPRRAATSMET
jgi:hypothetical protein